MTGEQSTMLTGETDVRTIQITVGEPVGFGDGALHAPEQSTESLAELGETIVNKYLTKVDSDAPGVCMDGRPCACLLHNTDATDPVGPKSAGGPLQKLSKAGTGSNRVGTQRIE